VLRGVREQVIRMHPVGCVVSFGIRLDVAALEKAQVLRMIDFEIDRARRGAGPVRGDV
jgi:hypothetical protein